MYFNLISQQFPGQMLYKNALLIMILSHFEIIWSNTLYGYSFSFPFIPEENRMNTFRTSVTVGLRDKFIQKC